jgi:serine/threonine protein kinase
MRFVHSRGLTHCDLKPESILLDWDWSVGIADFGRRTARDRDSPTVPPSDVRYFEPECFDNKCRQASDVFAFGMILYEMLSGARALPGNLKPHNIPFMIVIQNWPAEIPDSVLPGMRALIEGCWAPDADDRPTFAEIADQLAAMQFKVTANVLLAKVAAFVEKIEVLEARQPGE